MSPAPPTQPAHSDSTRRSAPAFPRHQRFHWLPSRCAVRKNLRRQLKEQGGDAVVMQMENVNILPTRKRGCSTSAEVATAAITAATVNAAAASAIAKGGRTAAARLRQQSRDVPRAIIAAHQLAQQMAHQLAAPVVLAAPVNPTRRVVVATACAPAVPVTAARVASPMPSSPLVPLVGQ